MLTNSQTDLNVCNIDHTCFESTDVCSKSSRPNSCNPLAQNSIISSKISFKTATGNQTPATQSSYAYLELFPINLGNKSTGNSINSGESSITSSSKTLGAVASTSQSGGKNKKSPESSKIINSSLVSLKLPSGKNKKQLLSINYSKLRQSELELLKKHS